MGDGETFSIVGRSDFVPGFMAVMPWLTAEAAPLPDILEGQQFPVQEASLAHQILKDENGFNSVLLRCLLSVISQGRYHKPPRLSH